MPTREADAIVVHDSNGNNLDADRLHHEKKVLKRQRFTLDQAKDKVPKVKNPNEVKDVIMMVGTNDSKKESETTDETFQKYKNTCKKYTEAFPNANLHITAVAPFSQKQINLNAKLQEYASKSKHSFISNQELFDRNTKKLRPNMLKGIHYTEHALRTMAKSIKRSIYAKPETPSRSYHTRPFSGNTHPIARESTETIEQNQQNVLITAITELTKTTQVILQKVMKEN